MDFSPLGYGNPKLSTLWQLDCNLSEGRARTCLAHFCITSTWPVRGTW